MTLKAYEKVVGTVGSQFYFGVVFVFYDIKALVRGHKR